jgi:diadenylate cyclase
VSEERGTISLAERGQLREIHPRELISCLERAPASRTAPATEGAPKWFSMMRHPELKLAALLSAVVLWLLFAYQVDTIQRTLMVPIEYRNLPEGWVVEEPRQRFVEVTLSGSERAVDRLDADSLVVSFNLNESPTETPVILPVRESLKLPAELTPHQIRPEHVEITLRRAPNRETAPRPEDP